MSYAVRYLCGNLSP